MKGLLKLVLCGGILYAFLIWIGPFLSNQSEIGRAFTAVLEENDLHSGALYYTDLPMIYEAEAAVQAGVKKGMEIRNEEDSLLYDFLFKKEG